jgi:hypothetical protein
MSRYYSILPFLFKIQREPKSFIQFIINRLEGIFTISRIITRCEMNTDEMQL